MSQDKNDSVRFLSSISDLIDWNRVELEHGITKNEALNHNYVPPKDRANGNMITNKDFKEQGNAQ